ACFQCATWFRGADPPGAEVSPAETRTTRVRSLRTPGGGGAAAQNAPPHSFITHRSLEAGDPAVLVGALTGLQADQLLAQAHGDRSGFTVADGELALVALDETDRRDDRGGPAREDRGHLAGFGGAAPLVDGQRLLLDGQAEVGGEGEE